LVKKNFGEKKNFGKEKFLDKKNLGKKILVIIFKLETAREL
jgi:hypothetical protein